ncbi:MAG TPA: Ig-like domain-containing protein [Asanoa sp.]
MADLVSFATPRTSQLQLADVNGDQKADVVQSADGHPVTVVAQRSATRPTRAWVRNVVPVDAAVAVSASVTPQVVLARAPVASSITAQTVRLVDATGGGDVPATRTWNATSSTLSVDPTGSLVSGHTYELVLSGLVDTTGLPLVLGTAFERGARSRFTVGSPAADTAPPDTVVRDVPDGPAVAFLADATEPGTTFRCATSITGPWWSCNNRSTNLHAGAGTSQATLYARAVDGGGRADPSPALLAWDDRGVERPSNDYESDAIAIGGVSGTITGTNMGADSGNEDPVSGASVFYRWTPPASGRVALSTEGSDFDTVLSVTRDDEGATLARDDDVSAVDRTSRLSVPVVAGHTYLVRVAGFQLLNPRIGAIRLAWSFTAAQNAPPTVAWSSPGAGAVLRDTVDLVATASDDIGVSKVEFLHGTTVLATVTAAPWSHWVDTHTLPDGPITLTVRATDVDSATASADRSFVVDNSQPTEATYQPLAPARILDTRSGVGAPAATVPAGGSVTLQVTGRGGVPASGVGAAVLNVTVTQPTAAGYLTVYPAGSSRPMVSNLNFVAGQTIPNLTAVKTGTGGAVTLYNGSSGTVHLTADIAGYYLSGTPTVAGAYGPLTPTRILDTRSGVGAPAATVPAGGSVTLQVTGRGGVPVSGVGAAVLNVTVTQAAAAGYLTVYPAGSSRPTVSNLNFVAGQTISNLTAVKTGTGGAVTLYNGSSGTVHLIADIAGYFVA